MNSTSILKIEKLVKKGVKIPNPDSVEIGNDVNIDRISGNKTIIYSGCKIFGSSTLILHGARLGYEGPVTVENCQVGPLVNLNAGFFKDAVFLGGVSVGFGSHIREGTILEEESSIGDIGRYRGRTQLLNLILALGYVIRIACRENHE